MFTLAKWYFDVVTADGTAAVGYSARLVWGRARVAYASVLISTAGVPPREATTFGDAGTVRQEDTLLVWDHTGLATHGCWHRLAPPIEQHLLHTPGGDIMWRCAMPRARVDLDVCGTRMTGIGYAEQLTLTLPPWRLPFRHLLWGRHASASDSLIWIAWHGDDERQFVWLDGVPQPAAVVEADGVRGLADGSSLPLDTPRDICARPAVARLLDRLPAPIRGVATPLSAMVEHKMVSAGRLASSRDDADPGWTLFEEVRW